MIELLTADETQIFVVALAVMLIIAAMEGVATLMGAGLSGFLDSLLPEVDVDIDIDLDGPQSSPPLFTRFLGWLRIGQVPVLMIIVIFLTAFGLIGLSMQQIARGMVGGYLPGWICAVGAAAVALPVVRLLGGVLAFIMPKDETSAVAETTFIGRIATITLGTARQGSPAEARLHDEHGQVHYIMLEPDTETEAFSQGTDVLVTERLGSVFRGIRNETSALVD